MKRGISDEGVRRIAQQGLDDDLYSLEEIAKSNALMAMDQLPDDLKGKDVWHFFMDYDDNVKDTVMEYKGTYEQAVEASVLYWEILKGHGYSDDMDDYGGD